MFLSRETVTTLAKPNHIGIIVDGNRRWAQEKGGAPNEGHASGLWINVIRIIDYCIQQNIDILSLFGFSTENWNRSDVEVACLMQLFMDFVGTKTCEFHQKGINIKILGDSTVLPADLQRAFADAVQLTKDNQVLHLNLAINYGGRSEIVRAVNKFLSSDPKLRKVSINQIEDHLDTKGLPDPDIIIRTGGEQRLSNFLIWQAAYSELFFCDKFWPDFYESDLDQIIIEYSQRQRRWGR